MKLEQALKWADDNSQPGAVERLRSRKVAQTLAMHIRRYRVWIKEQGEFSDTCTWAILGEVCDNCQCKRKPPNAKGQGGAACGASRAPTGCASDDRSGERNTK